MQYTVLTFSGIYENKEKQIIQFKPSPGYTRTRRNRLYSSNRLRDIREQGEIDYIVQTVSGIYENKEKQIIQFKPFRDTQKYVETTFIFRLYSSLCIDLQTKERCMNTYFVHWFIFEIICSFYCYQLQFSDIFITVYRKFFVAV